MHALSAGYVVDEAIRKAAIGSRQVKIERAPGCGGACEGQEAAVLSSGKAVFSTPKAPLWVEYTDGTDKDYLAGFVDNTLEVYAVARTGTEALACRVALEPDFQKVTDSDVLGVLKAVDSLDAASIGMSRPGGFCGSLQTDGRWATNIRQALHQALYRPWAVSPWTNPGSENSYGDYDRILPQLRQWSLGGFSEQAAFQLYKDRIAATEKILADFYGKQFAWKAPKAESMAHAALINAISSGFGFYSYKPFENEEEERLRTAIFAHAPMAQIRAIPLDVKILDPAIGKAWPELPKDSLLNVAIAYPEVLQYLLDKGFDPNRANPFGKTPLMYAAQYNQLEAARLLLKAGADPNARTTRPPSECGYVLSTTSMTPLHYAVRNAGTPLIQTLLKSGAVTFIKAHKNDGKEKSDEAPLDWLHRYTSGEPGKEQNPNLMATDIVGLEKALASPDPAMLARISSAQVLLGEKQSAAGHDEAAYQAITIALQADPNNQKALADLPMLARKTNRPEEAAAAATRATTALKSDAAKASAWFNLGLICQKQDYALQLDGTSYCNDDKMEPFLRAWRLAPTESRARKLVQVMEQDAFNLADFCVRQGRAYRLMIEKKTGAARVYVLHPAGETIDPKSVGWTIAGEGKAKTFVSPTPGERNILGSQAMTVLKSPKWDSPTMVNGQACSTR